MTTKTFMITDEKNDITGIVTNVDDNTVRVDWSNDESVEFTNEELGAFLDANEFVVEEVELELTEADQFGADSQTTPASSTIVAHKNVDKAPGQQDDGNPKTRMDWIKSIIGGLADLSDNECEMMAFQATQGRPLGDENPQGNVDANRASITMKPSNAVGTGFLKTEQDKLFGEAGLTEEAQAKISTLFEVAVSAAVVEETEKLLAKYDSAVNEAIKSLSDEMVGKISTYVDKVANEWLEENKVATESTLRTELTMEALEGLKTFFETFYIDIPEDKVNVLEAVVEENEKLRDVANEITKELMEKDSVVLELQKKIELNNLSEGLTLVQKQKLGKLVEGVIFENTEDFGKKVSVIKEGFLKETSKDTGILTASGPVVKEVITEDTTSDPAIAFVAKRIAR